MAAGYFAGKWKIYQLCKKEFVLLSLKLIIDETTWYIRVTISQPTKHFHRWEDGNKLFFFVLKKIQPGQCVQKPALIV